MIGGAVWCKEPRVGKGVRGRVRGTVGCAGVSGLDRTEGELRMEGQGAGEDPSASEEAKDVSGNREDRPD